MAACMVPVPCLHHASAAAAAAAAAASKLIAHCHSLHPLIVYVGQRQSMWILCDRLV
jgi:hypothetical protein